MIGRSRLLLGVVIVAVASTAPASVADAHVPDGHVITGSGTTNYGNKVSITSTDLPGAYGSASYNGTNITLKCVDVNFYMSLFWGYPTHSYKASGQAANGDTYSFSIISTSVSRVEIQKNNGLGECGFATRDYYAHPDSYEHTGTNGAFVIKP